MTSTALLSALLETHLDNMDMTPAQEAFMNDTGNEEEIIPTTYIVSNQIKCLNCGDTPFSMHRHDFTWCECGSVAVDGGQDYLKRVGSDWEEMSITIDEAGLKSMVEVVEVAMNSRRNPLGVTLAALRAIRDAGIHPVKGGRGVTDWEVVK